jgi:hypothetical protein
MLSQRFKSQNAKFLKIKQDSTLAKNLKIHHYHLIYFLMDDLNSISTRELRLMRNQNSLNDLVNSFCKFKG